MKYVAIFLLAPFILNAQLPASINLEDSSKEVEAKLQQFAYIDDAYSYRKVPNTGTVDIYEVSATNQTASEVVWNNLRVTVINDVVTECVAMVPLESLSVWRDILAINGAPGTQEHGETKFETYDCQSHFVVIKSSLSDVASFRMTYMPK